MARSLREPPPQDVSAVGISPAMSMAFLMVILFMVIQNSRFPTIDDCSSAARATRIRLSRKSTRTPISRNEFPLHRRRVPSGLPQENCCRPFDHCVAKPMARRIRSTPAAKSRPTIPHRAAPGNAQRRTQPATPSKRAHVQATARRPSGQGKPEHGNSGFSVSSESDSPAGNAAIPGRSAARHTATGSERSGKLDSAGQRPDRRRSRRSRVGQGGFGLRRRLLGRHPKFPKCRLTNGSCAGSPINPTSDWWHAIEIARS